MPKKMEINKVEYKDTKIGVITSGVTYNYVKEALPDVSVLKLGMVHPLPAEIIRSFAEKVDQLYVVEELEPFFEDQIKAMGIKVIGEAIFSVQGEYSTNLVAEKIGGEVKTINDPGAFAAASAGHVPGMSAQGRLLYAQKTGHIGHRGYWMLYIRRNAAAGRDRHDDLYGRKYRLCDRHGKGQGQRLCEKACCSDR